MRSLVRAASVALLLFVARASFSDPMNGSTSPTGQKHPGTIFNDDRVHHRTFTQNASEVPQTIAWVEVDGAWHAVVKIVVTGVEGRLEITQYGAHDERLKATYQAPPPRRP